MAAAARGTVRPAPPDIELTARHAPVEPIEERATSLPYPEPVGINDNSGDTHNGAPAARAPVRRLSTLQLAARILIAPLYAVVAAGAFGIIVLFGRGLLGL